jgi:anti-sigma regulatory factor (Ser/Thr protein kinase)
VHSRTSLPADPRSAAVARRHVAETLRRWGMEHHVDNAALIVSELVGNAVRHAGTVVELVVHRSGSPDPDRAVEGEPERLQLEVRDYSNRGVAFTRPSLAATGGRGLALLSALSSRWGVEPRPPVGKSVWCEVVADSEEAVSAAPSRPADPDPPGAPVPPAPASAPAPSATGTAQATAPQRSA